MFHGARWEEAAAFPSRCPGPGSLRLAHARTPPSTTSLAGLPPLLPTHRGISTRLHRATTHPGRKNTELAAAAPRQRRRRHGREGGRGGGGGAGPADRRHPVMGSGRGVASSAGAKAKGAARPPPPAQPRLTRLSLSQFITATFCTLAVSGSFAITSPSSSCRHASGSSSAASTYLSARSPARIPWECAAIRSTGRVIPA